MRFITILLAILAALELNVLGQVTEEQCQQADAQLNQVYKQLMGTLNDSQKLKLKQEQREWIKKRDGLMRANLNPQYAFHWLTTQRSNELLQIASSQKHKNETPSGQKTNFTDDQLQPYPQSNHMVPISCASVSNDGKYIVTGDGIGVVKIWDSKNGFLLKTINVGSSIIYARIDPSNEQIYIINKERRENPRVFSYSLKSAEKINECDLTGINDRAGECYISRDGNTILLTGDSWLEMDRVAYFKNPLKENAGIKDIKPNDIISKDNARRLLVELQEANIFDQFGTFYGGTSKNTIYSDKLYTVKSDVKGWSLNIQNATKYFPYTNQIIMPEGIDFSADKGNILVYNKSSIKVLDAISGKSKCNIHPDYPIKRAAFSPDSQRIVCVGQNSSNIVLLEYDSNANLLKSNDITDIIRLKDSKSEVQDIKWVNKKIYISLLFGDLLSFSNNLDYIKCYERGRIKNLGSSSVIASLPSISNPTIDTSASVNLLNPDDDSIISSLKYSYQAPSCKYLDPFDVNSNLNLLVKGYWWRGGGGLFICQSNQVSIIDGAVFNRPVSCCQFLNDRIFVNAVSPDGNQSNLQLLATNQPFSPIYSCDVPAISDTRVSSIKNSIYGIQNDGIVACYKVSDNRIAPLLSYLIGFNSSIIFTPELQYLSQGNLSKILRFTRGLNSFPLEQFDLRLNRPDIVLERLGAPKEAIDAAKTLREKRLKKMNVTEEMLRPDFHLPEVALTSEIPSTISSDQIDLKIKASDDKYPLERLRVYVNNVPINGTEGESLRDQKTQNLEKTIPIKLAAGRNKIQVSVLNSAGAESLYANAEVTCTAQRPKPTLYVVSMGVSKYANPDNNLKYAAKDAEDLAKKLKDRAGSLYGEVKELVLKDQDVSKENLAKAREFLKPATIDDSVVLFMAGHGLLDDKYDYYFGTSDIDPAHPEQRGIPFEEMDEILASLPCLKKSMLVDTCHAGELDADEKKQLAASDASAQGVPVTTEAGNGAKVAMRAIGTRGMQVKAIEGAKGRNDWYERLQDMFVDLRRGSGSTILSSSEGAEYAYESSDQQNGLFTYALMEALDGKGHPADAKSPEVTMSEVAEYVKKRVGDLTNHKQTPNARRVNLEGDFALGTTK